jgi:hypothetical protein
MNLVTSFADDDEGDEEEDNERVELTSGSGKIISATTKDWIREYKSGCGWEIYTTRLSKLFVGSKFAELSYALYEKKGVVLFALQITDLSQVGAPRLLLNPSDYVIPDPSEFLVDAFVIAQNKADSDLTLHESTQEGAEGGDNLSSLNRNFIFNERRKSSMNVPRVPGKDATIFPGINTNNSATTGNPEKEPNSSLPKKKESRWKQLKRSALLERKVQSNSYQEIMHRLEAEHFKENYYVAQKPLDINECTVKTSVLNEYPFINQHLIVVGKGLRNLYDLIRPLRAKYQGPLRYIVLLYPHDIPHDVWQRISVFDSLLIIRGSCLEESQLRRAGIFRAAQVVVLADGSSGSTSNSSSMGALVDSEAIFTYQHVKRMNPSTQVVLEFVNQSNISYLKDESKVSVDDPKFTAQFAAGSLFTTSLLDSIVCQAYYNPQIIKVINKLISGIDELDRYDLMTRAARELANGKDDTKTDSDSSGSDAGNDSQKSEAISSRNLREENRRMSMTILNRTRNRLQVIRGSCLYQMAIPENLEKRTYGGLYQYLASRGKVPLGLLRGIFANMNMGPKSNLMPYVYTNPDKDTELYSCDRVFVLSTTPERVESKVDIKDWLLDLQMSKSREINKESKDSPSKSAKTSELLERQQKKMEDRLSKFSGDVNKKLASLLELIDKSARFTSTPSIYASPSQDGTYSFDESPSATRTQVDSRISNASSLGRSRGESMDSANSSEAGNNGEESKDEYDIDKDYSNGDTDTNPSICPSPITTNTQSVVGLRRQSQPSSAPGVLRMPSTSPYTINHKRPSLTVDGVRIMPIMEHSTENSISREFPEEGVVQSLGNNGYSSSNSSGPSTAAETPDITAKAGDLISYPQHGNHMMHFNLVKISESMPTLSEGKSPVKSTQVSDAGVTENHAPALDTSSNKQQVQASLSASEKKSVNEVVVEDKLFSPVREFGASVHDSDIDIPGGQPIESDSLYVSSTDVSDTGVRLVHPKASRPKYQKGPRISHTAEKSIERQMKLRSLREKNPSGRVDPHNTRKAQESAVLFSEFMASKLRQQASFQDKNVNTLQRSKTAPSMGEAVAYEGDHSDMEKV